MVRAADATIDFPCPEARVARRARAILFGVGCVALLIAAGCTSDPTSDSLQTRTENSSSDRNGSSESAEDSTTDGKRSTPTEAGSDDKSETASGEDAEASTDSTTDGADSAEGTDGAGVKPAKIEPADVDVAEAVGDILIASDDELSGAALEEHIADRFEAFWLAFDIARTAPSSSPETDYPALLDLAAGEQLDGSYAALKELHRSGQAIRNPETPAVPGLDVDTALRVRVDSVDGGVAELTSCLVNDQIRYEVASGTGVGNSVTTVTARSTMAKADGSWKLIRSEPLALDPGVGGCWLEDESSFTH